MWFIVWVDILTDSNKLVKLENTSQNTLNTENFVLFNWSKRKNVSFLKQIRDIVRIAVM